MNRSPLDDALLQQRHLRRMLRQARRRRAWWQLYRLRFALERAKRFQYQLLDEQKATLLMQSETRQCV